MPTIPICEIIVLPQPRKVFRGIDDLAADIREHGLLQPPTITPSKRLVYGERRFRACKLLGMDTIDVLYCEEMPEDEILERQVAENVARDDLSWQERCLAMLDLYRKKRQRGALEGWTWGQREASDLFKIAVGTINYVLRVAKRLEEELKLPEDKRRFWQYESVNEAYRLGLLQEEEDKANAILAQIAKAATVTPTIKIEEQKIVEEVKAASLDGELVKKKEQYESNPLNVVPFEQYWAEKVAKAAEVENTVYLSNVILNVDCIGFMTDSSNADRFHHIITDPPYAIDMENLQQEGTGSNSIDMVFASHDVQENMDLLGKFFYAAWRCTKEGAFVCVCCDAMMWQYLYGKALEVGFAVQRWPYVWRKVNQSVRNSAAQYNTTKDYELVMICRKPGATLSAKRNTSFTDASNVEAIKLTGHPFAKPFELTSDLLDMVSIEGQTILEPFAGHGSMVLEILRRGRHVVAIEKDTPRYNKLLEVVKQNHYLRLNPNAKFK